MQPISPLLVYAVAIDIQQVHTLIKGQPPGDLVGAEQCKVIAPMMEAVRAELVKLNCTSAARSAAKPVKLMNENKLTYGLLVRFLEQMDDRIRDEAEDTYAFSLTPLEAVYFDPAEPLLGADVALKFESAAFDIEEAGKCHALGRSTAAIFHALRVLEVGIKAVGKCLDIPEIEKPSQKNWGFILKEIKGRIEAKWPTEKERESGDGELFEGLHLLMAAIKVPRNKTMHPARKYTEQEADRLLRVIGDVMMELAKRCDEKGEPKA